ncbi:MAG: shikimate dehydrogenase [Nanoarchaeota archaeon]|nr:shikimate dehydrogenase [Nanoarchaeota archaeon]
MICCSIAANEREKVIEDMLRAKSKADLIEIRLDYISELNLDDIREIISRKPCPLIMTCRKKDEGGKFSGTEERRLEILKKCIEFGADYLDIELSSGKEIVSELIENKDNSRIIVSYHNFDLLPENIDNIYAEIKATGCDIVKAACMANSLPDNLRMFELIKKAKNEDINIIGICMGEKGEISRILNTAYGSYLTFGCLDKGKESAPGQISCEFLKHIYRADKLNLDGLKIYGLVGKPVSESKGYIVHNLMFKENDMNAVYLNFLVDDLKNFVDKFRDIVSGFSVTMPYKQDIMEYLDEVESNAGIIGAVNTVVLSEGKLIGYNTDYLGAVDALEEETGIEGRKALMLGAGGAARAIGYGIMNKNGRLIIVNRTSAKGEKLASELSAQYKNIEDVDWNEVNILINATSIGMMPDSNETPIDAGNLRKEMVVFDSVYNPPVTKLLKAAEQAGCITVSGINMFINQAARQFELFTKKKCDKEFMKRMVLEYVAQ